VVIETLSSLPIDRQIEADGPTWLDRQITRAESLALASQGFGHDVSAALARRQQWLIDQGLMQRDGTDILFRKNLLDVLRQRELQRVGARLSSELGVPFVQPLAGERIEGIYRRPVELAGGRYALIEKSREFTLVPWKPVLDRHIDQYVSGRAGASIDWTNGRGRGGPSL